MTDRSIACFPASKALLARLRDALGPTATLTPFTDVAPLIHAIRHGRIQLSIVTIDLDSFEQITAMLRRIHVAFPSHPLVGYYHARALTARHLLELAHCGVVELVQAEVDDSRHVLGRILESAVRISHVQTLSDALLDDIPVPVRPIFLYAIEHAGRSMKVPELCAALGVSKRTLSYRLQLHGAPSARLFLTWCRLLVAGLLLNDAGRTLDAVADQLNFPSGHALGNLLARYFGRGVDALRTDGISREVIAAFRTALTDQTRSLPPTTRKG